MKPRHESATTVIVTPQQRQVIAQLADKHLMAGGSVLAQVFPDGLRLRVLTPEQTVELQQALAKALGQPVRPGLFQSAFQGPEQ